MITVKTKTSLLLVLSAVLLSGCNETSYAKNASASDFVDPLVMSALTCTEVRLYANASAVTGIHPREALGGSLSTHGLYFYSDQIYSYSLGATTVSGIYKPSLSTYYLLNDASKLAYIYTDTTAVDRWRAVALAQRDYDYSVALTMYATLKSYCGKTAAELGFTSLAVNASNLGSTLGFNSTITSVDASGVSYEDQYYFVLDQIGNGYGITDYIHRKTTRAAQAKTTTYSLSEYKFSYATALPSFVSSYSDYRFIEPTNQTGAVTSGDFYQTI